MGVFDTIVFQKPIACKCGKNLESMQVKLFENALNLYRIGDVVQGASDFEVLTDITYCEDCNYSKEIYIAIANKRYLGVFESYRRAKQEIEENSGLEFYDSFYDKDLNSQISDRAFMVELVSHFENNSPKTRASFSIYGKYFEDTPTALEAIKKYLQKDKIKDAIAQVYHEKCEFDISYEMKKEYITIHNPKIEKILSTKYIFKLAHSNHHNSTMDEEAILETNGELDEDTVLDKVQEWLDVRGLRLQVVLI